MKKIDRRDTERRADDRRLIERRVVERFSMPLKGKAVFEVGSAQDESEIMTRNINAYGAYFESSLQPSVSGSVKIFLPIEQAEGPFEVSATVVRVDQLAENLFGIAIEFDEIPDFE